MGSEVMAELFAGGEEGADTHAGWPFARNACAVQEVPGLAEILVLCARKKRGQMRVEKQKEKEKERNVQTYPYAPPSDYRS